MQLSIKSNKNNQQKDITDWLKQDRLAEMEDKIDELKHSGTESDKTKCEQNI